MGPVKRQLLLLSGKINSGKDFTADILVKTNKWKKMPFAEHLKMLTAAKFNVPLDDLCTQPGKRIKYDATRTYRDLCIETADFYKRNDQNFFVNSVIERIRLIDNYNIVIPDFRYPNEHARICEALSDDFEIKTGLVYRLSGSVELDHPSEKSLVRFPFDIVLYNYGDGDEEKYKRQLTLAMRLKDD